MVELRKNPSRSARGKRFSEAPKVEPEDGHSDGGEGGGEDTDGEEGGEQQRFTLVDAIPAEVWTFKKQDEDALTRDLPFEVLSSIVKLIHPRDLLSLSRCCKSLRNALLKKSAEPLWSDCVKAVKIRYPSLLCDMSWPGMISLIEMRNTECSLCGGDSYTQLFWTFRLRLCHTCIKENIVEVKQVESILGEDYEETLEYCRRAYHRAPGARWHSQSPCYLRGELDTWSENVLDDSPELFKRRDYVNAVAQEDVDAFQHYQRRLSNEEARIERERSEAIEDRRRGFIAKIKERMMGDGANEDDLDMSPIYSVVSQFRKGDHWPELDEQVWENLKAALHRKEVANEETQRAQEAKDALRDQATRKDARSAEVGRAISDWLKENFKSTFKHPLPNMHDLKMMSSFPVLIANDAEEKDTVDKAKLDKALVNFDKAIRKWTLVNRALLLSAPLGDFAGDLEDWAAVKQYLQLPTTIFKCEHARCNALLAYPEVLRHHHAKPAPYAWGPRPIDTQYDAGAAFDICRFSAPLAERQAVQQILNRLEDQVFACKATFESLSKKTFIVDDASETSVAFLELLRRFTVPSHGVKSADISSIRFYTPDDAKQNAADRDTALDTYAVYRCTARGCDLEWGTMLTKEDGEQHLEDKHPIKQKRRRSWYSARNRLIEDETAIKKAMRDIRQMRAELGGNEVQVKEEPDEDNGLGEEELGGARDDDAPEDGEEDEGAHGDAPEEQEMQVDEE